MTRRAAPAQMKRDATLGISTRDDNPQPPPCAGLPDLFMSTLVGDHIIARDYCKRCPIIELCATEFKSALADSRGCGPHAGPEGTWAGVLYDHKSMPVRIKYGRCKGCRQQLVPGSSTFVTGYVEHDAKGYCRPCYQKQPRRAA